MAKKNVILFRSPDLPKDFEEELRVYYEIFCVPVLTFTYVEYEERLLQVKFEDYEAIIFPSQRAVIALSKLSIVLPQIKIFAVGEATAQLCCDLLQRIPDVIGQQGAKELCTNIILNNTFSRIIYLCGDNQATLPYDDFQKANIEILEFCCYGTRETNIEELKENLMDLPKPDICVFFSPSGVNCIFHSLEWN